MADATMGIVLSGASGWLGSHVLAELTRRQILVISAGRTPPAGTVGCHISLNLDADEPGKYDALAAALRGAKRWAFVHCAGLAHVQRESLEMQRQLWRVNVDGTRLVVDLCRRLGIGLVVYVSSTSVYGADRRSGAVPRSEEAATNPDSVYGKSKLAAEQVAAASGLDWRVARPATLFGVGDTANFFRLAKAIRQRRFVIPGSGEARKSCLPVDVAAHCIATLATDDDPAWRLVNLALPQPPTLHEICQAMAVACQVPAPRSVPNWLVAGAGRVGDVAAMIGVPSPLTSATYEKMCSTTWVDCQRATLMFPAVTQTTFESAMRECAGYYGGR